MTTQTTVLYPTGNDNINYHFEVANIVQIEGDERLKYPIPGQDDEYYTSRLDTENAIKFEKDRFTGAMDKFYSILMEKNNEN